MAPLLPIVLQLAQFAPHLMRFFGAGETSTKVVEGVVDVAKSVTGAASPEEALEIIKVNAEAQIAFRQRTMDLDADLEKAYLQDRQDARKRDATFIAAGTRNYRADLMAAGAFVVVIIIAWKVWTAPNLPEYAKGIITLVLGRFLGYCDQIFQFEFGSVRDKGIKQ